MLSVRGFVALDVLVGRTRNSVSFLFGSGLGPFFLCVRMSRLVGIRGASIGSVRLALSRI
jgi:hypothetical protein